MTYTEQTDVLVIGGGTAGHIAAIQAARAHVRTTLVEMNGQLGGTLTSGGINYPSYFYGRGDRQIIAGIGWELVKKTVELDGSPLPDFATPNPKRPSYPVWVNPYTYAALAEEAATAAGVVLHYHELATDACWDDAAGRWQVDFVGKGLRRRIMARELIDCTGGADIVGMLGFARVRGEPDGRDVRQPGTLAFRFFNYDKTAFDAEAIQRMYKQAVADGRLVPGDFQTPDRPFTQFLGGGGLNKQHIFAADDTTSDGQTDANIRGRASMLRLLRFVRTLPGCQHARIEYARPDAAIRETYRIVGETTITVQDYTTGRVFDDAVGYTLYFIDLHTEQGGVMEFIGESRVPTIPLSALVPKGSRHLLAAGRCISSDRLANSALRVQSSCMAMGQAAGAAAALAVKREIASRDVPMAELRQLLKVHGAILPEATPPGSCSVPGTAGRTGEAMCR